VTKKPTATCIRPMRGELKREKDVVNTCPLVECFDPFSKLESVYNYNF